MNKIIPYSKKLILASRSPRRIELLHSLGFEFSTISLEVEEKYPTQLIKGEITEYLSKLKADAFGKVAKNEVLITADTIVWFQNQAMEKPGNHSEAIDMVLALSGNTHEVYTSVGFSTHDKQYIITDQTEVEMATISKEEAEYYVNNYPPLDKAGAYGIQDWLGLAKVKSIKGSFYNVMGFPTHLVYEELMKLEKEE